MRPRPPAQPTSVRERWSAAAYIASATLVITLVVLAVVFDQFAATGVLLVAILSFILTLWSADIPRVHSNVSLAATQEWRCTPGPPPLSRYHDWQG